MQRLLTLAVVLLALAGLMLRPAAPWAQDMGQQGAVSAQSTAADPDADADEDEEEEEPQRQRHSEQPLNPIPYNNRWRLRPSPNLQSNRQKRLPRFR